LKNLLYKEFKLVLYPPFYLVLLLTMLILIPSWVYFIAMSYIFFIVISNIFTLSKTNNDITFSMMMPVKKTDIVKARLFSVSFIELLNIAAAVPCAIINNILYKNNNALMNPNIAFFGFVFIMYGIFNLILFPTYYKTGYKLLWPLVGAMAGALGFAEGAEFFVLTVPVLKEALNSDNPDMLIWKLIALIGGILIFVLFNIIAFKLSVKRFNRLDF